MSTNEEVVEAKKKAIEAAKQKALEIAARLSGRAGNSTATNQATAAVSSQILQSLQQSKQIEKKIFVPVQENPDTNFLGILIGPKGSTQRWIQNESGAKVYVRGRGSNKDNPDEGDEDLHVFISGDTEEQVDKASHLVSGLLYDKEFRERLKEDQLREVAKYNNNNNNNNNDYNNNSEEKYRPLNQDGPEPGAKTLWVPNSQVGLIIGRGGETIRMIIDQSGARCQIELEDAIVDNKRPIHINGTPDKIEIAEQLILRVLEDAKASRNQSLNDNEKGELMEIPNELVGLLIGRGGTTLQGLQQRTGCRVHVQRDNEVNPATNLREVTLFGPPDIVANCKLEIDRILQGNNNPQPMPQQMQPPSQHMHHHQQPPMYHQPMMQQQVMPVAPISQMPSIEERPLGEIYQLPGGGFAMTVPGNTVGMVIGRNGDNIRMIQSKTGCRVQVSKDDSFSVREVYLNGPPQSVEPARVEVQALVDSCTQQATGTTTTKKRTHDGNDPFSQFLTFAQQYQQMQQYQAYSYAYQQPQYYNYGQTSTESNKRVKLDDQQQQQPQYTAEQQAAWAAYYQQQGYDPNYYYQQQQQSQQQQQPQYNEQYYQQTTDPVQQDGQTQQNNEEQNEAKQQ